jgi:hypothetical protein
LVRASTVVLAIAPRDALKVVGTASPVLQKAVDGLVPAHVACLDVALRHLSIQTFGDTGMAQNDNEKHLTLHAALRSNGITLFASDGRPDQKVVLVTACT